MFAKFCNDFPSTYVLNYGRRQQTQLKNLKNIVKMPHNTELLFFNPENISHEDKQSISVIVHKKKMGRSKKKNLEKSFHFGDTSEEPSQIINTLKEPKSICSAPDFKKQFKIIKVKTSSSLTTQKTKAYNSKYAVNHVSEFRVDGNSNPFGRVRQPIKWRVYRCQFGAQEESCCCSCNSDAMFEVMKSLYDCYKKKNCDHCNCILCGHLPREERKAGEARKSAVSVGVETASMKVRAEKMNSIAQTLQDKSAADKEKILRQMVMDGIPLPEGKSPSEKDLIKKVRHDLGLPPEPASPEEKAKLRRSELAGMVVPLEGKTPAEKEKILRKQASLGLPFPVGRTLSEKALIDKIRSESPIKAVAIPSEKLRKAKTAGFLTPLEGKSPANKEKILRGLAMSGIPLPEGKTPSEKKLIEKVRNYLGLPPQLKSAADKEKYKKGVIDGIIEPLEGKTPEQKEKILRRQLDAGLPLPEGRTPSEKALIAEVRATAGKPLVGIPSERMRKAKAERFLTPLEGKTPEQKEKMLRRLAQTGLPLPEGKTPSEKALIKKVKAETGYKTPAVEPFIMPSGITPEKLKKAKAEGLLTPLAGKTPTQNEKILRGLAKHGISLPEPKTTSERKLVDKIRKELGLPPEPKTRSIRDMYNKAQAQGIITPLGGKTSAQKENILKRLAQAGLPLPEGRTPSEKALINKIKAETGYKTPAAMPSGFPAGIPSEKLQKAKAEGLVTPLTGKTPEQKEKILRGLAKIGIPLPEAKTSSEKKLIDKIRKELGLSLEPKSPSMKDKYYKAQAQGIITPLERKTPAQKEKILKGLAQAGIPLPEGRTPSEKALINKVKAETGYKTPIRAAVPSGFPVGIPFEKLRKAKAAGLLTPLAGKTPEQKEKILKGLAKHGIPLPEGKTPSEKKLIDKVRRELGLPPRPKSPSMKEKYKKAQAQGILTPLEGKSPAEKEKILRALAQAGLPLPEGRTPSEKALINKVKTETGYKTPLALPAGIPSEKLRKAKAAGLLTPLTGKTPEQKEKILKGLAAHRIPLPEPRTPSEKTLVDKIRKEIGLPPEPKSPSIRERFRKAQAAGIITPLEGKTPAQKEYILRKMAEAGIPLPEGRTPSEKALIDSIKTKVKARPSAMLAMGISSEKLRKAKAAGLLTPLAGKTPEQKEKILKGLAKHGIPLPEGKTPSEKKLIDKVRKELGLPPEPRSPSMKEKYQKAQAQGLLTPLEGKTSAEKEKILRALAAARLPLPEGRTLSEKALVDKVKAELAGPKSSEKMKAAKAAGILTPLEGKTPEQKEKILRSLAMQGLPFPLAKTESGKKLQAKVRADLGMPPEPKNATEKDKYDKAMAQGVVLPLEGKNPAEKEKILRDLHNRGINLPVGRTPSEKSLIAKIKAETPRIPSLTPRIPSEKLRKAKAAGLLTPLDGKTPAQKEQILRALAEQGLPLSKGKTQSEKALIQKVKAEFGLPPEAIKPSEKEIIAKAKAEGLLTPLTGKTPEQKEKILKGLAEAGLPLPEGKTSSEKSLIKKVRAAVGLPPEPTPSERIGKVKKKDKKIGLGKSAARRSAARAAGIEEQYKDIQKTTKCDRGCGCDKKKIRFKHSYVKIRVTSPDISSLCPCPEECVPGVKGGVFVDNEGIKVTVGSAIGVPSLCMQDIDYSSNKEVKIENITNGSSVRSNLTTEFNTQTSSKSTYEEQNYTDGDTYASEIERDSSTDYNVDNYLRDQSYDYIIHDFNSHYEIFKKNRVSKYMLECLESAIMSSISSISFEGSFTEVKTTLNSIVMLRTESSLSFSSNFTASIKTISLISLHNSSIIPTSSHYICYPDPESASSLGEDDSEYFTNEVDYTTADVQTRCKLSIVLPSVVQQHHLGQGASESDEITNLFPYTSNTLYKPSRTYNENIFTYRMSQQDVNKSEKRYKSSENKHKPLIIINELNRYKYDVMKIVKEVISKQNLSETSSIFVVVPTSDEDDDDLTDSASSTICIRLSENFFSCDKKVNEKTVQYQRLTPTDPGLKFTAKGKYNLNNVTPNGPFLSHSKDDSYNNSENMTKLEPRQNRSKHNKKCQVKEKKPVLRIHNSFSMDTSQDRPCCCKPPRPAETYLSNRECSAANVLSDLIMPMIVSQGLDQEAYQTRPDLNLTCQTSFLVPNHATSISTCKVYPCAGNAQSQNFCGGSNTPAQRIEKVPMKFEMKGRLTKQTEATGECPPCECVKATNTDYGCKPSDCKYPTWDENEADKKKVEITPIIRFGREKDSSYSTCTNKKEKRVTLKEDCPCDGDNKALNWKTTALPRSSPPAPPPTLASATPTTYTSTGCQCCMCDIPSNECQEAGARSDRQAAQSAEQAQEASAIEQSTTNIKKSTCQCDSIHKLRNRLWRRSKNIECECPPPGQSQEDVEEEEIDYSKYAGEYYVSEEEYQRQMRQKQTELTQTTSGFKIVWQKRSLESSEMSFEEALKYYEEHPEDVPPPIQRDEADNCTCGEFVTYPEDVAETAPRGKGPTGNTRVECECPPFEEEEDLDKSGGKNLKGLKLHIGAKGTSSKGLSGICCFDMLQESNRIISP